MLIFPLIIGLMITILGFVAFLIAISGENIRNIKGVI